MGIMSNDQADALLAGGKISPETHAMIVTQNAPNVSVAPPPEAPPITGPGPIPVSYGAPYEPNTGAMDGGSANLPARPSTHVSSTTSLGDSFAADAYNAGLTPESRDARERAAMTGPPGFAGPSPDMNPSLPSPAGGVPAPAGAGAPGPAGDVVVGPITATGSPSASPASSARSSGAGGGGAARSSGMQDMVKAQNSALEAQKGEQGELNRLGQQRQLEDERIRAEQQGQRDQQRVLEMAAKQDEAAHMDELVRGKETAIADYRSSRIDPTQVTKNRGVLGNVLAAIAVGAGAFGASITHGPNYALQILDKQTDDNIRAQEAALTQKGKAVDFANNSIAQYRQITGDNAAARAAVKADLLTDQRDELAANLQKFTSAEQQARGQQTLADLDAKIGENNAAVKMAIEKQSAAQAAAAGVQRKALEGKIAASAQEFMLKGQEPVEALRNATAIHTGQRVGSAPLQSVPVAGSAEDKKVAREAKEKQGSLDEASRQFDNMRGSPLLEQLGVLPGLASGGAFSQRAMPESAKTGQKVRAFNLVMAATAGKTLKDSEGRIPPSTLEQIHEFYILPGDTKEIAQEKISGLQDFVHEQARQSGASAPEPNAPRRAASDEGVGFTPNR